MNRHCSAVTVRQAVAEQKRLLVLTTDLNAQGLGNTFFRGNACTVSQALGVERHIEHNQRCTLAQRIQCKCTVQCCYDGRVTLGQIARSLMTWNSKRSETPSAAQIEDVCEPETINASQFQIVSINASPSGALLVTIHVCV